MGTCGKRSCLRNLKQFPCVKRFVRLPNVGHCPHDEAPDRVNPVLEEIISEFTSTP
jgi:pimeloyl-ACP methyl ester carboxylesterase